MTKNIYMYKSLLTCFLITISFTVSAKKVKFAVDMTGQVLSPNGIHITGDFQTLAGFPGGDWQSNTTPCLQEGSTNIYSIIVDIPAFSKYEYKFVNGDQFYEVEFVPAESRVGYNFVDNRWLYVDSLADDTTFIGALLFSGNAPAGLTLVRYLVDMQNMTVPVSGAHVSGDFQGWNPATTRLYSFGSDIYEIISYVDTGVYAYKFYNGNTSGDAETIPTACAVNGNRQIHVTGDVVLPAVCFNACVTCALTGISGLQDDDRSFLVPNPAQSFTQYTFNDNSLKHRVIISDMTGRTVRVYSECRNNYMEIKRENLQAGVYLIHSINENNYSRFFKLIFE